MRFGARLLTAILFQCMAVISIASAQEQTVKPDDLNKVYQDETHCLTTADMRGERDDPVSCFCRDAIEDARYVYFTYLQSGRDRNLNGTYLRLVTEISTSCGKRYDAWRVSEQVDWQWDGPEVVRTYPSDDVIKRIVPEMRDGQPVGRWVPFTVQLVFRDKNRHVTRTENYSSREFIPTD